MANNIGFNIPELMVESILRYGLRTLSQNPDSFDRIFSPLKNSLDEKVVEKYSGEINDIKDKFKEEKIHIKLGYEINMVEFPSITILAKAESENNSPSSTSPVAMGDFIGMDEDEDGNIHEVKGNTENVDITMVVQSESRLYTLYLATLLKWILLAQKGKLVSLGFNLSTYSVANLELAPEYPGEKIYSRVIELRGYIENRWKGKEITPIDEIRILLSGDKKQS